MRILCSLLLATAVSAHAKTWNFSDSKAISDWVAMGKTHQEAGGIKLGPSDGDFAISGFRLLEPVKLSNKSLSLKCKISDTSVENAAAEDLENGNDIRINIVLNSIPAANWDSEKAVINVTLFYNSVNHAFWVGLFGKGDGFPGKETALISSGTFLGDDSGNGEIEVSVTLDENKIHAIFSKGGVPIKELDAEVPAHIKSLLANNIYLLIIQQNIGKGTGSIVLNSAELN
ncbi:MAG: hypothetical protein NTZ01_03235 [Verrucomicrobia bacterium]|nr:hypothetical protein [Verrucomicrobiota bacterium]